MQKGAETSEASRTTVTYKYIGMGMYRGGSYETYEEKARETLELGGWEMVVRHKNQPQGGKATRRGLSRSRLERGRGSEAIRD